MANHTLAPRGLCLEGAHFWSYFANQGKSGEKVQVYHMLVRLEYGQTVLKARSSCEDHAGIKTYWYLQGMMTKAVSG